MSNVFYLNVVNPKPNFTYHLSNFHDMNYAWITNGLIKIYRIIDINQFYASLGYKESFQLNCVEREFYIWETYFKDSSVKDNLCLQAKIIQYLQDNSEKFRREYCEAYLKWLGACDSKKMNHIDDCLNCKMHSD
jgi:hypothetical protein